MEVHLTDDQKAFIREAIQTGCFACAEDALHEAFIAVGSPRAPPC